MGSKIGKSNHVPGIMFGEDIPYTGHYIADHTDCIYCTKLPWQHLHVAGKEDSHQYTGSMLLFREERSNIQDMRSQGLMVYHG